MWVASFFRPGPPPPKADMSKTTRQKPHMKNQVLAELLWFGRFSVAYAMPMPLLSGPCTLRSTENTINTWQLLKNHWNQWKIRFPRTTSPFKWVFYSPLKRSPLLKKDAGRTWVSPIRWSQFFFFQKGFWIFGKGQFWCPPPTKTIQIRTHPPPSHRNARFVVIWEWGLGMQDWVGKTSGKISGLNTMAPTQTIAAYSTWDLAGVDSDGNSLRGRVHNFDLPIAHCNLQIAPFTLPSFQ